MDSWTLPEHSSVFLIKILSRTISITSRCRGQYLWLHKTENSKIRINKISFVKLILYNWQFKVMTAGS